MQQQQQQKHHLRHTALLLLLLLFIFTVVVDATVNSTAYLKAGSNSNFVVVEREASAADAPRVTQIQVFMIPHSHCDPGWKKTLDTYFQQNVTNILTNTLNALASDPKKRFVWAETVYWKMWWEQQTLATKTLAKALVQNGQLEFVNGGFVMHDEATPDYIAMVDQMTEGHQYLMKTMGVKPRVGWSIDPFGASRINPVLNKLMGMQYHVINRVDDRLKFEYDDIPDSGQYIREKKFEFYWSGSHNYLDTARIFTHILEHHYSSPVYCQDNTCSGFDFEGDATENPPITSHNIDERARLLASILQNTSLSYRTRNILVPFGNDFRFQDAELEFSNMDKLIKYINANSRFNINIKYATLSEYFDSVMKESDSSTFPVKNWNDDNFADYFPYTNCWGSDVDISGNCIAYWSGYFTSHPEFKAFVRAAQRLLRTAEAIFSLGIAQKETIQYLEENLTTSANQGASVSWDNLYRGLSQLREAVALAQHHDAITGTETEEVLVDYVARISAAMPKAEFLIQQMLSFFLVKNTTRPNLSFSSHHIMNTSMFEVGETQAPVVIFNSLGWERSEYVRVPVNSSQLEVISHDAQPIPFDIVNYEDGTYDLYFLATIPPLGFNTYFIRKTQYTGELIHEGRGYFDDDNSTISLNNEFLEVIFGPHDGNNPPYVLQSIRNKVTGEVTIINQQLMQYTSWKDGAYIFRPTSDAEPLQFEPEYVSIELFQGDNVQEIRQQLTNNVTQIFRVYNGFEDPEVCFFVEMETIAATANNKELISRFSMSTNGTPPVTQLFTDSNGFEMTERPFAIRFNDTTKQSLIAGNYYPMVRSAFIRELEPHGTQFTLMARHSMGVASLSNGSIEYMINRNSLTDDGRGLGQPLNVSQPISTIVRFMVGSRTLSEDLRPRMVMKFEYTLDQLYVVTYANKSDDSSRSVVPNQEQWPQYYVSYQSALSASLPQSVMIASFQTRENITVFSNTTQPQATPLQYSKVVLRLHHLYSRKSNMLYSHKNSIFVSTLFEGSTVDMTETTLSLMHTLNYNVPDVIRLEPGQIRTFVMRLNKNGQLTNNVFSWFQLESYLFGLGSCFFGIVVFVILAYIFVQITKKNRAVEDEEEDYEEI